MADQAATLRKTLQQKEEKIRLLSQQVAGKSSDLDREQSARRAAERTLEQLERVRMQGKRACMVSESTDRLTDTGSPRLSQARMW